MTILEKLRVYVLTDRWDFSPTLRASIEHALTYIDTMERWRIEDKIRLKELEDLNRELQRRIRENHTP